MQSLVSRSSSSSNTLPVVPERLTWGSRDHSCILDLFIQASISAIPNSSDSTLCQGLTSSSFRLMLRKERPTREHHYLICLVMKRYLVCCIDPISFDE